MYETIHQVRFKVPEHLMFCIPYYTGSLKGTSTFSISTFDFKLSLTKQEHQDIDEHFKAILDIVRK